MNFFISLVQRLVQRMVKSYFNLRNIPRDRIPNTKKILEDMFPDKINFPLLWSDVQITLPNILEHLVHPCHKQNVQTLNS